MSKVVDILWREGVILEARLFRAHADSKVLLGAIRTLRADEGSATLALNREGLVGNSPPHKAEGPTQPSLPFGSGDVEDYD